MLRPEYMAWLRRQDDAVRLALLRALDEDELALLDHDWQLWGRAQQRAPSGPWSCWLICAGRGFGKTRAGAEWVREQAINNPDARIALVAATLGEARAVMVEGESGLLNVCPPQYRPDYEPSLKRLVWPGGAQAFLYSAAEPESLRGPQHSAAWCDEIAKWDNASERATRAWDNLQLGLRLGPNPRVVATTTPRAVPLVRRLMDRREGGIAAVTRGTTYDNAANLPPRFVAGIKRQFGRTALGRQELDGELLEDVEGALWSRSLIERCRGDIGERGGGRGTAPAAPAGALER